MATKLKPLTIALSEEAHKKIALAAAPLLQSKTEWVRQLVLNTIELTEEIKAPKTNAGYIALAAASKKRRTRK